MGDSNPAAVANIGTPNVTKVTGFNGQAVHIETDIVNGDTLVGEISKYGRPRFGSSLYPNANSYNRLLSLWNDRHGYRFSFHWIHKGRQYLL